MLHRIRDRPPVGTGHIPHHTVNVEDYNNSVHNLTILVPRARENPNFICSQPLSGAKPSRATKLLITDDSLLNRMCYA